MPTLNTKLVDLTGQRFTRLCVLKRGTPKQDGKYFRPTWDCICDCGSTKTILEKCLKSGHTKSCGCLQRDTASEYSRTHGLSHLPEYDTWCHIIARCEKPDGKSWNNYGGRGITMCPQWRESFECFLQDMGRKPTPQHTIERVNNDKGYSPDNCIWATMAVQNTNKRNIRYFTLDGETLHMTDWAHRLGTRTATIVKRLNRGWTIRQALLTPILHRSSQSCAIYQPRS